KYSLQDWVSAFLPSRLADGSYIVNHEQWMEKKKFRYTGPVGHPFEPSKIPEKEYDEADFLKLLKEKIIPNTIFDESAMPQLLATLKVPQKLKNGKINL